MALNQTQYKHLLLTEYNDPEFMTVLDPVNKKKYNVHRGTVNQDDLLTDSKLAANQFHDTDRMKRSTAKSQAVNEKYSQFETIETGHSLGGALAEEIALRNQSKSVVFNRGSTPLASYDHIDRDKHIHYRTDDDLVSYAARKGSRRRETAPSTYSELANKIPQWGIAQISNKLYNWYHSHLLKNMQ